MGAHRPKSRPPQHHPSALLSVSAPHAALIRSAHISPVHTACDPSVISSKASWQTLDAPHSRLLLRSCEDGGKDQERGAPCSSEMHACAAVRVCCRRGALRLISPAPRATASLISDKGFVDNKEICSGLAQRFESEAVKDAAAAAGMACDLASSVDRRDRRAVGILNR